MDSVESGLNAARGGASRLEVGDVWSRDMSHVWSRDMSHVSRVSGVT